MKTVISTRQVELIAASLLAPRITWDGATIPKVFDDDVARQSAWALRAALILLLESDGELHGIARSVGEESGIEIELTNK